MRGKIAIALSVLLAFVIIVETVFVVQGMRAVPTVSEKSSPQSLSFLLEEYNQSSSIVLGILREYDRMWQQHAVVEIYDWIAAQENEDSASSEMGSTRDELVILQLVMSTIRSVYEQLQEGSEGSFGAAGMVNQMTVLAEALYNLNILDIEDSDFMVQEDTAEGCVERPMTSEERTALILTEAAKRGYIQFDADAFWDAVNASKLLGGSEAPIEEEIAVPPDDFEEETDVSVGDGEDQLEDNASEREEPSGEETEDSTVDIAVECPPVVIEPKPGSDEKTYYGQFKATMFCTCELCYISGTYAGVLVGDNIIFADKHYVIPGSNVTLDTTPDIKFVVQDGTNSVGGRDLMVFCSNHEIATNQAEQYVKVYIYK